MALRRASSCAMGSAIGAAALWPRGGGLSGRCGRFRFSSAATGAPYLAKPAASCARPMEKLGGDRRPEGAALSASVARGMKGAGFAAAGAACMQTRRQRKICSIIPVCLRINFRRLTRALPRVMRGSQRWIIISARSKVRASAQVAAPGRGRRLRAQDELPRIMPASVKADRTPVDSTTGIARKCREAPGDKPGGYPSFPEAEIF